MHTIDIYRGPDLFVSIKPDDSSNQVKRIMGENELHLQFEINHFVEFAINDYATVFGEVYMIFSPPVFTKTTRFSYNYNMVMKAEGYGVSRAQFLFYSATNILKESDFSLMGTAEDFLDLIVENANRVSPGWQKGQVVITEYKNLSFSTNNCFEAIKIIADAFSTEYFIEGKIIHLTKRQRNIPIAFRHGKNKGLYEIKRTALDSSGVITRLYAYGSDRNLPIGYRHPTRQEVIDGGLNHPPVILSPKLLMPKGQYIVERNIDKYGIIEATYIFDEIYPQRTGQVTSLDATDIYEFSDSTLDFDINNQLLPGLKAKITFNTGLLAGYAFDIETYDHATRTFRIIKNKDEKVLDVPNSDLKAAIGDTYVLTDIDMPESYLTAAEVLLKFEAEKYLYENSEPLLSYQVVLDPVYIRRNNISFNIGDVVNIKDAEINVDRNIRIISSNRKVVDEDEIQIELSDKVPKSPFTALRDATQQANRDLNLINRRLQNTLNGRLIGDVLLQQGSIIASDLPTTSSPSGFSSLVIDNQTGRIYRQF